MNGPLIDAAKKILKRKYGVECTEPFAGVDRFRRTTGNSVAQVDLESWRKSNAYKLRLSGFCYDNDETYEGESKVKMTEFTNPTDVAEIIDEQLSKVETNLAIIIKMNRPYSKKKRILNIGEAKEILEEAGLSVESEEDRFVRDTITKMVNDFPNKSRNKAIVNDPEKGKAVEEFIRNYYNSMPSIDDCIERLYAVIEDGTL